MNAPESQRDATLDTEKNNPVQKTMAATPYERDTHTCTVMGDTCVSHVTVSPIHGMGATCTHVTVCPIPCMGTLPPSVRRFLVPSSSQPASPQSHAHRLFPLAHAFSFPFFSIRYNFCKYSVFARARRQCLVFYGFEWFWNRKTAQTHWQSTQKVTRLPSRCDWNLAG
jgi:hypothetical protein